MSSERVRHVCTPLITLVLLREWRRCTVSAELIFNLVTGVIIHCRANILGTINRGDFGQIYTILINILIMMN